MIEYLENRLKKDDIIFTKFEKISDHKNFIISEDETVRIKVSRFNDFEIQCTECGNWYKIKNFHNHYKTKKYLCATCNHIGDRNPMYGKHLSEETKEKIAEK